MVGITVGSIFSGMAKYWLNRLLGRPSVQATDFGTGLLYRENGRSIRMDLRTSANGGAMIDVDSIMFWNEEPTRTLDASERRRIAHSARDVMLSQWGQTAGIHGDGAFDADGERV